jgi:uncharacterized protein YqfA (UPF0365 family)
MKAKVAENRASVVLSQAEVPLAIAEAFRQGRLDTSAVDGLAKAP